MRLCHIHSLPQFSSTSAWCVSRNTRDRMNRSVLGCAAIGSPAAYASRSAASAAALW